MKSLFKNIVLALVIASLFSLMSCQQTNKVKIGFMLPTYDVARYAKDRDYFTAKVKELGGEVLVANAENDDKKQLDQAQALIQQGVNVIVIIAINQNTAAAIVREAHNNGVKVIAYERMIQNCDLDCYITFDNKLVGKTMAEYALKLMPEGNFVLLGGDKTDKNAILLKEGQNEAMASYVKSGKVKVIYDVFIEDWSTENAKFAMQEVLRLNIDKPNVIISSNDGMAEGAINALTECGLAGSVVVTGQDAELSACKRILAGTQAMTVYKPLKKQGEMAAVVATKLAKGEQISEVTNKVYNGRSDVPSILLAPIAVDKSNMQSTVIADGFYKESELK
jgi:D-xylose transport system substrate-binding protein